MREIFVDGVRVLLDPEAYKRVHLMPLRLEGTTVVIDTLLGVQKLEEYVLTEEEQHDGFRRQASGQPNVLDYQRRNFVKPIVQERGRPKKQEQTVYKRSKQFDGVYLQKGGGSVYKRVFKHAVGSMYFEYSTPFRTCKECKEAMQNDPHSDWNRKKSINKILSKVAS